MPFDGSFIDQIQNWCLTWLPILLMGALVYLIWRTLKSMPRTKPQQIRPEASSRGRLGRRRGLRRGKARAARGGRVPA